jgi:mannose-6-phosphate isomerase-like protein (cupin superfamily)
MNKVNVQDKLSQIDGYWQPRIAGSLNGQHVKLVKVKGEFVWHHHADADELFFVIQGRLTMRLKDGDLILNPGEFCIVPRGVEHLPVADEETHLMLFEPAGTLNTGNVIDEKTVHRPSDI